ncbi:Poly(ADP-ribose) glycohydrolase [Aphelenchoides besseyi]|nr:Poly(ADP-ribose) glycohydrolase [Aphelenchoides besseyi]
MQTRDLRRRDGDFHFANFNVNTRVAIPNAQIWYPPHVKWFRFPTSSAEKLKKIKNSLDKIADSADLTFDFVEDAMREYTFPFLTIENLRKIDGVLALLPKIAKLALKIFDSTEISQKLPLLLENSDLSVSLSQQQAAILLANGFFCTHDDAERTKRGDLNLFSFKLFQEKTRGGVEKLKCFLAYFETVIENPPNGIITVVRQKLENFDFCALASGLPLTDVKVDTGTSIEHSVDAAHVDFANRKIGGGVLWHGTIQEEIRFSIAPEALIGCLLCSAMRENEAILIVGAQQYSTYSGYSRTFKFESKCEFSPVDRNDFGHFQSHVIAIDAADYTGKEMRQYDKEHIDRDLLKATVGFATRTPDAPLEIATGAWGCGNFKGNVELKFLIQWLAASFAGRSLRFHTFNDTSVGIDMMKLVEIIRRREEFDCVYELLIADGDLQQKLRPFAFLAAQICDQIEVEEDQDALDIVSIQKHFYFGEFAMDKFNELRKQVRNLVQEYPDFPKSGVNFWFVACLCFLTFDFSDILPLMKHPKLVDELAAKIAEFYAGQVDYVAGLEARGFLFGPLIAVKLSVPFVPIRKKGKLPGPIHSVDYEKEYGLDSIEIQATAFESDKRVLVFDDLLATGGTLEAAKKLIELAGAKFAAAFVLVDLLELKGREKLGTNTRVDALLQL